MYRVDLDLDREQVKQLRQLALDLDTSVRGLVTQLAIREIQENQKSKNKKQKEVSHEKVIYLSCCPSLGCERFRPA